MTQKGFCLPQRIVLALMAFLGFMCEYMMRNLLSIAITQIAKSNVVTDEQGLADGAYCPLVNETSGDDDASSVTVDGTYEWSEAMQVCDVYKNALTQFCKTPSTGSHSVVVLLGLHRDSYSGWHARGKTGR